MEDSCGDTISPEGESNSKPASTQVQPSDTTTTIETTPATDAVPPLPNAESKQSNSVPNKMPAEVDTPETAPSASPWKTVSAPATPRTFRFSDSSFLTRFQNGNVTFRGTESSKLQLACSPVSGSMTPVLTSPSPTSTMSSTTSQKRPNLRTKWCFPRRIPSLSISHLEKMFSVLSL